MGNDRYGRQEKTHPEVDAAACGSAYMAGIDNARSCGLGSRLLIHRLDDALDERDADGHMCPDAGIREYLQRLLRLRQRRGFVR